MVKSGVSIEDSKGCNGISNSQRRQTRRNRGCEAAVIYPASTVLLTVSQPNFLGDSSDPTEYGMESSTSAAGAAPPPLNRVADKDSDSPKCGAAHLPRLKAFGDLSPNRGLMQSVRLNESVCRAGAASTDQSIW